MIEFTTPVARIVSGNVWEFTTKDFEGNDKFKKGTSELLKSWKIGVAIPKGAEKSWFETEWGLQIYNIGATAFPQQCPSNWAVLSWKVYDGDDIKANPKGLKFCDREGHAGHWILYFTTYSMPQVVDRTGATQIVDKNALKPGYYVQVRAQCKSNDTPTKPGVYLSHEIVSFQGYGEEIQLGSRPDPTQAGFGEAALPAGATTTPPPGMTAAAPTPAAVVAPALVPAPVVPGPAVAAPLAPVAPGAAPVVPVAPGPVVATVAPVAAPLAPGAPVPPVYTPPQ